MSLLLPVFWELSFIDVVPHLRCSSSAFCILVLHSSKLEEKLAAAIPFLAGSPALWVFVTNLVWPDLLPCWGNGDFVRVDKHGLFPLYSHVLLSKNHDFEKNFLKESPVTCLPCMVAAHSVVPVVKPSETVREFTHWVEWVAYGDCRGVRNKHSVCKLLLSSWQPPADGAFARPIGRWKVLHSVEPSKVEAWELS